MKTSISIFISIFSIFVSSLYSQEVVPKYNILISGASFATENNGWFEIGCETIGANPINRAIGGESIAKAANRMVNGELYSMEELENIDVFVIMQVHEADVFDETQLLDNYEDYQTPLDLSNYAIAFDYVVKKYLSDCYNLKNNLKSKYFGSKAGKPARIILCTHWHDARIRYNKSVRKLAEKWGFALVEFDKNIGFSMNQLHPVTKEQVSLIYSDDEQIIRGEKFGWHPEKGRDKYIQQKMANIFAAKLREILPCH